MLKQPTLPCSINRNLEECNSGLQDLHAKLRKSREISGQVQHGICSSDFLLQCHRNKCRYVKSKVIDAFCRNVACKRSRVCSFSDQRMSDWCLKTMGTKRSSAKGDNSFGFSFTKTEHKTKRFPCWKWIFFIQYAKTITTARLGHSNTFWCPHRPEFLHNFQIQKVQRINLA